MNVLLVNASLDPMTGGGTAERTFQLARHLAPAGAHVSLLCLDLDRTRERASRLEGVVLRTLRCAWRRYEVPGPSWRDVDAAVAGSDVVLLSNHWSGLNALAFRAAQRRGTPHLVCPAGALPVYGRSRGLKSAYNRCVGTRLVRRSAGWIAISPNERAHFTAYGVDASRVLVIPNGVDASDFSDLEPAAAAFRRNQRLGDAPYLLFLGRLAPIKGPDLLLDAYERVASRRPEHLLLFAGPDEGMQSRLEAAARRAKLSGRVRFVGALDSEARKGAYAGADLVAIPSRQEAMSLTVLEAAACARPVLITDACGFPDVAEVGGGLVVPAAAEALAEALETLLSEPNALPAMGARLRSGLLPRYSWERAASAHLELFREVLARGETSAQVSNHTVRAT